jgi:hypothetical protein
MVLFCQSSHKRTFIISQILLTYKRIIFTIALRITLKLKASVGWRFCPRCKEEFYV